MRQISPNELADWLADPERQRGPSCSMFGRCGNTSTVT